MGRHRAIPEIIFNAGYASPVRTPRGRDILVACGQLKSATENSPPASGLRCARWR
jgi:adenine C2-methylase RlmN of 23S rRNA A2503 and tRNA A37